MQWELTPKQVEFANAVFSGKYRYLLYGGAIRGSKTWCALFMLYTLCRVYPGSRWAIVRKDLPTLRRNVIPSFERTRPTNFVNDINQSTWTAKCTNGSEIIFFAENYIQDKELDRWKGLEVNGFVLEEANELNEKSFDKAIERAGSWIIQNGQQPDPYIILTCNPANNWVKNTFYDKWKNNELKAPYYYLPAKITDNPHLPKSYIDSLKSLKEKSPATYDKFVNGNWDVSDDKFALIKYEWLHNALSVDRVKGLSYLGVDVARYGADRSCWALRRGNTLKGIHVEDRTSLTDVAKITKIMAKDESVNAENIHIDGVGIGAGVVDSLREDGWGVVNLVSGAKAIERKDDDNDDASVYTYKNLRSQMWWEFRELLRNGIISFDFEDLELFGDLAALRYEIVGDKMIQVESKDKLKERIGRSPDKGDAVVYAFFDIPQENKTEWCFVC